MQTKPGAQTLSQAPQFCGSVERSAQLAAVHNTCPAGQGGMVWQLGKKYEQPESPKPRAAAMAYLHMCRTGVRQSDTRVNVKQGKAAESGHAVR
jgi:hypothetical protein